MGVKKDTWENDMADDEQPTNAEIETARRRIQGTIDGFIEALRPGAFPTGGPFVATFHAAATQDIAAFKLALRALDALACEPELLAQIAQMKADDREYITSTDACMASAIETNDAQSDRIADLKARERRVREVVQKARAENLRVMAEAERNGHETWEQLAVAGFLDDVLAILDGKVTPPAAASPTITLDATKAGTIAEEAGEPCPRCHGSGRRVVDLDEAACPRCGGTGRATL